MTITLRQESDARATTKGSSLTYAELDDNFIDLLNRQEITVEGDSGAQQLSADGSTTDKRLVVLGGTNVTTSVASDSTGQVELTINASSSGLSNVVEDTTPQLGGMLDVNGNAIGDGSLELLKFSETASAVNEITITNAATGGNPDISATGDDTNIDLSLTAKGTGEIALNDDTNVNGNKLKDAQLENYKETIHALSYAANISPDVANGNVQEITLTGNVAFDGFSNAEDGQSMTLIIHQDGTGSRTFSENLDSAGRMLFAGGTSTLTTDGGATDIMSIVYAGGIYYASLSTNFS